MVRSRFTLMLPMYEQPDRTIIFDTLRGTIKITERDLDQVDHAAIPNEDDLARLTAYRAERNADPSFFNLVILPTLNCNFACPYCYEVQRSSRLSTEVIQRIKRWADTRLAGIKTLKLHWFGGEPLLATEDVLSLTHDIRLAADRAGVKFIGHLTSNGYLLDERRRSDLIDAGILDYRVTFDGPAESHNQTRITRGKQPTFERLVENITALARADQRIRVQIRSNFTEDTLPMMGRLLDAFPPDIRGQLRPVLEPIFGHCGVNFYDADATQGIAASVVKYYVDAECMGYDIAAAVKWIRTRRSAYCWAEQSGQLIINHEGDLFKCSVDNFESSERLGLLDDDGLVVLNSKSQDWDDAAELATTCQECAYLPLCLGGCRQQRIDNGRPTVQNCIYTQALIDEMVRAVANGHLRRATDWLRVTYV